MFRLIIEKELRDIISSTKFALTFGVCSILIVLSFYVGARNYEISREQYDAAKQENARKMEGLTDWRDVREHRIFLPPRPTASLVMGVSNDIGRNAEVRGRGELNPEDSRYGEDPIYAVFRFLDLDFIFQIILSLFAILFAYDAINGEKERGTLRLTFANAIPRSTYILGKMSGSFLALAVPLLIPMLIGSLILVVMGVPMHGDDWVRLLLIVVAGFLYFGAFLALSLFVSSRTERSSNSFLILLVAWIVSVMILPRTAVLLAGRAVDVPSVDEIASKKSRFSASMWQEDRKKMADFRAPEGTKPMEVMQEFQKFMSKIGDEREAKMQEFSSRLNEERANKQRVQEQVAFGLARLSPSATFSLASAAIAGTGTQLKQEYKTSGEQYQRAFGEFMKGKTGMNMGGGMVFRISTDDNQEKKTPINIAEIPEYEFRPQPIGASLGHFAVDFGVLALFNILFFVGAFVSFLRYDLR
jgi:ABC-type transport system involved in multi-copper enzyme maturation permease subunit